MRRESAADSGGVGDLLRQRADVDGRVGWFRPGIGFWREDRENVSGGELDSGKDQVEVSGKVAFETGSALSGHVRVARRTTDVVGGQSWVRDSVGRTIEARADLTRSRSLRARVSWVRRELEFAAGRDGVDRTTHLTRSDLSHESLGGRLRGEWAYETTSRFFGDRLALPGQEDDPTLAVKASTRLRFGASRRGRRPEGVAVPMLDRILDRVRAETVVRIEEETTDPDRGGIYLLDLSRFQDDRYTVFGRILLREEITLFPGGGPFTMTARWERIDTEDNRADPNRTEIVVGRTVIRATNRLASRWTLETQGSRENDTRSDSGTGVVEYDVRRFEIREELAWQPRPTHRVAGRVVFVDEADDVGDASIQGLGLGLATSAALFRKGRWTGDVSWTRPVSLDGESRTDRFRTKEETQFDWRTSLDLRLSDSINASITYSGRAFEGRRTNHLARAEARALF